MTVRTYLGERYEHSHENEAFDRLCQLTTKQWGDREATVSLIGNVTCNGCEMDALLIKPDAIIVIDFKNHGGTIKFSENGPWLVDGVEVKGGGKANPYRQIHTNKFALLEWLNRHCNTLSKSNNLGHISGLALFHKSVNFNDNEIPPKVASWFGIGDFTSGFKWLVHRASAQLSLSNTDQQQIIKTLNVQPYHYQSHEAHIERLPEKGVPITQPIVLMESQESAMRQVRRLLHADEFQALLIAGMSSTGKTALAQAILEAASEVGRDVIPLSPNSRLGSELEDQTNVEFRSLYSHLYNLADSVDANEATGDVLVRPIRACKDAPNAVYLVDEGQLLSDGFLDFETERFGTGHTISDFLSFASFKETQRKLIVLGDSYQIRGCKPEEWLLNRKLLEEQGLGLLVQHMDQIRYVPSREPALRVAAGIAADIDAQRYNRLEIAANKPTVECLENTKQAKLDALAMLFADGQRDGVFLAFSNQAVQKVNQYVRTRVLHRKNVTPEPGDRLELFNKLCLPTATAEPANFVMPGERATVHSCGLAHSITQELKGRDNPVVFNFAEIEVSFDQEPTRTYNILYLQNFLLSEKPELDKDQLVALRAYAEKCIKPQLQAEQKDVEDLKQRSKDETDPSKVAEIKAELKEARGRLQRKRRVLLFNEPHFAAARFRYAYASTCHRARGRRWARVMVDTNTGQGRNNEAYFRWLYTAITRADEQLLLANFLPLTPLVDLNFVASNVAITQAIKSPFQFSYPKDAKPKEQQLKRTLPEGLAGDNLQLINLWLHVAELLDRKGIVVSKVKQSSYQEQYTITNNSGQKSVLAFSYNGKHDVTSIRQLSGDKVLATQAFVLLQEPLQFADPLAQQMLEALQFVLELAGFTVEGGTSHDWHFFLYSNADNDRVRLKANYNKEGKFSRLTVEQATSGAVIKQLEALFIPTVKDE